MNPFDNLNSCVNEILISSSSSFFFLIYYRIWWSFIAFLLFFCCRNILFFLAFHVFYHFFVFQEAWASITKIPYISRFHYPDVFPDSLFSPVSICHVYPYYGCLSSAITNMLPANTTLTFPSENSNPKSQLSNSVAKIFSNFVVISQFMQSTMGETYQDCLWTQVHMGVASSAEEMEPDTLCPNWEINFTWRRCEDGVEAYIIAYWVVSVSDQISGSWYCTFIGGIIWLEEVWNNQCWPDKVQKTNLDQWFKVPFCCFWIRMSLVVLGVRLEVPMKVYCNNAISHKHGTRSCPLWPN